MIKAKIAEIFQSAQGEGVYFGIQQVFVRFFGCNLRCVYCDTLLKEFNEYDREGLKDSIGRYPDYHSLCLTGGEPLCQADFIKDFLEYLGDARPLVYLETNGTLKDELLKILNLVDIIAMDFKLPSSSGCGVFWPHHESFLRAAIEKDIFVKLVIGDQTQKEDITTAIEIIRRVRPATPVVLQPDWFQRTEALTAKLDDFKQEFIQQGILSVNILPQAHKLAGIR